MGGICREVPRLVVAFTARCPGPRAPAPAVPPAGCPVCDLLCSFRNRGAPMRGRRPTSVGLEGCNAGANRSSVSRPSDEDDGFMVSEFFDRGESVIFDTHLTPGGRTPAVLPLEIFFKTRALRAQRLTSVLPCRSEACVLPSYHASTPLSQFAVPNVPTGSRLHHSGSGDRPDRHGFARAKAQRRSHVVDRILAAGGRLRIGLSGRRNCRPVVTSAIARFGCRAWR